MNSKYQELLHDLGLSIHGKCRFLVRDPTAVIHCDCPPAGPTGDIDSHRQVDHGCKSQNRLFGRCLIPLIIESEPENARNAVTLIDEDAASRALSLELSDLD